MFRELIDYCLKAISSSGHYSLALQHTTAVTFFILCFWSENVIQGVCIGEAPRGMFLPRKFFSLVASFLNLFETAPTCVSLVGFGDKLNNCLAFSLRGVKPPSVVNSYRPAEFERVD